MRSRPPIDVAGPRLFQTTEEFGCRLAAVPGSVAILRGEITAIALRRGLTGTALTDVALAISEAATNAVVHGSDSPSACIGMSVRFARGNMQVTISDEGRSRAASRVHRPDGGYGLPIIQAVTTGEVIIAATEHGTTVTMDFACPARAHYGSLVRRRRPAVV